jgi:hypothetical protein
VDDMPRTPAHLELKDWPRAVFLRWCGPEAVARGLHLQPGHPGHLIIGDEDGVLINWADARGTRQYYGRLEGDWLEVVSAQQHHQACERLRASGWPGFPVDDEEAVAVWRAEPHPYHRLHHLDVDAVVRWRGPDGFAHLLGLQPGHPGQLRCADPGHAVIDWVDAHGVRRYDGRFDPDWLESVSAQEHERAARELRATWPGFTLDGRDRQAAWTQNGWINAGDPFLPDTRVKFVGPLDAAHHLGVRPDHPGTVRSSSEKHAIVDWVDVEGVFQHRGVMSPEILRSIDEVEFQLLSHALRTSGWRGFRVLGRDEAGE